MPAYNRNLKKKIAFPLFKNLKKSNSTRNKSLSSTQEQPCKVEDTDMIQEYGRREALLYHNG
jgi:hypothetical protein